MKQFLLIFNTSLATTLSAWSGSLDFKDDTMVVDVPVKQTRVIVDYPFTNTSDKPVSIRRFDAPCACLTAETVGGTKAPNSTAVSFEPGESGSIKGILDLGKFKGTIEKKILVWTDSDKDSSPSIRLSMTVKVPYQIAAFPNALSWKKGSAVESKELSIKVMDEKPINIRTHKSSSPAITYKIETIKEGFEYKVTVTPKSTAKTTFASIQFTTDSKNPRSKRVTCFTSVKP